MKAWRERFLAHRDDVERLYDARFVRMWEFYLAASEMAFRESDLVVFQIQMAKRKGVVPQTRDYIAREEARLRTLENGHRDNGCVWRANSGASHRGGNQRDVKSRRVFNRRFCSDVQWVTGKAAMSISQRRLLDYRR